MTLRTGIIRTLRLWALACLIGAGLGASGAWAHGGHHHQPAPATQAADPHAGDHHAPPEAAIAVAAADLTNCAPAHAPTDHGGCCTGPSCCTAGCTAAFDLAPVPGLALTRATPSAGLASPQRRGRDTRPAEHPPRSAI